MSRIDLEVYNEATGFTIASEGLCGRDLSGLEPGDEAWMNAVADGVFLPFELVQDDGFLIRVVVDEPLTAPEADEWVACTRHGLRIPDGRLLVMGGGPEYFQGEDVEEFTRAVDVPPGDYLAEVYTYLHGVNGEYALDAAGPPEALGAYFCRTRPGEPFPRRLRAACRDEPDLDPGHEEGWRDVEDEADEETPSLLGFLLRLTPHPHESGPAPTEDGWFEAGAGARRPATFPSGIPAEIPAEDDED